MKTAVVTGASGMLGSALVGRLNQAGRYAVVSLTRRDADLLDAEAVDRVFSEIRPDIVFHCAAKVAGLGGNSAFPADFFDENILINTHVIRAAHSAGANKFVGVGTTAVYSDGVPLPMKEGDIWIGPPHHSEAAYGVAKRAMLTQLQAYEKQYGMEYGYGILTNLYGPNDTFDKAYGHVVPSLICKIKEAIDASAPLEVWGDGSPQRDFLYVDDAADALIMIGERGKGPYNIASGKVTTIRELVEMLTNVSGFAGEVVWATDKPNGQLLRQYDVSSIRALGFDAAVDLHDGLRRTLESYLRQERER